MVFMVVDTNNYDVSLRFDFLIKIGAMVDVEHGLIQVKQGLGCNVQVLPLTMVNILQIVIKNVTLSYSPIFRIIRGFSHFHIKASEKQNNLHHDLEDLKGWCNHIQNDHQFYDDYGSTFHMDHYYNFIYLY